MSHRKGRNQNGSDTNNASEEERMSALPPMTTDELLELAPLDALGLLDEYDALLFSRAYHSASEPVRRRIRDLQAEVAGDPAILPDVELPEGMRQRVVAAVSREAEEASDARPLATIGAVRPGQILHTLDRPGAPVARLERRRSGRRLSDSLAGNVWRAASFGLAAALIVTIYFGGQTRERNAQLAGVTNMLLAGDDVEAALDAIPGVLPRFAELSGDRNARRIAMTPIGEGPDVQAVGYVLMDPETGNGLVVVLGMPGGEDDFRLVARDGDGKRIDEQIIRRGRGVAAAAFEISSTLVASASFEIIGADGSAILAT